MALCFLNLKCKIYGKNFLCRNVLKYEFLRTFIECELGKHRFWKWFSYWNWLYFLHFIRHWLWQLSVKVFVTWFCSCWHKKNRNCLCAAFATFPHWPRLARKSCGFLKRRTSKMYEHVNASSLNTDWMKVLTHIHTCINIMNKRLHYGQFL